MDFVRLANRLLYKWQTESDCPETVLCPCSLWWNLDVIWGAWTEGLHDSVAVQLLCAIGRQSCFSSLVYMLYKDIRNQRTCQGQDAHTIKQHVGGEYRSGSFKMMTQKHSVEDGLPDVNSLSVLFGSPERAEILLHVRPLWLKLNYVPTHDSFCVFYAISCYVAS